MGKLSALVPWPPRVTHVGVSLTRICYAAIILVDMAQIYRWRHTSFDPTTAWVGQFVVPACMLSLLLLGAGFATRFSAIAVFVLSRMVFRYLPETYALDHITRLVSLVFVLAPAPRAFALDLRLRKTKSDPFALVPAWFSLALFLVIELVYANSVLYKLRTIVWRDGLAFWLSTTLPHFSAGRLPDALKIPFVLKISTYVALGLETFFPLVLVKPFRRWVLLVGAFLHLGIAIFLPIPLFGLGFTALYLCFVDWEPIARRFGWVQSTAPTDVAPVATLAGRYAMVPYALPLFLIVGEAAATIPTRIIPALASLQPTLSMFGLTNYGVYLDFHFTIPKPIVRVVAKAGDRTINLPSFDERGYSEVTGRYWAMVAIGELRWHSGDPEGDEAMNRYLTGTLTREGISEADFSVYGRDVSVPLRMTPNLEDDVAHRPWKLLATGTYHSGHTVISWAPDAPLTTQGRVP